nr:MAG TPA_asm: Kruppel-like factor 3 ZINC FINGER, KRUPPEL-LIKE, TRANSCRIPTION [Bacteriophage sp.]
MDLAERMSLTKEGQVTWADPEIGQKCSACRHVQRHAKPKPFRPDQCALVFTHSRRHGVPFDAKKAIACSKFEM